MEEIVEKALKLAKNGSTIGQDGCPYKLWKKLQQRYEEKIKEGKQSFDIIGTLTSIFQDIQWHGIEAGT